MRPSIKFTFLSILFFTLTLFNLLTIKSPANIVLSLAEAIVVVLLVLFKKKSHAIIWHFLFVLTCISANTAFEVEGLDDTVMYSYSRLKVIGPIGLSYVISIFLLLISWRPWGSFRSTLFYELFKTFRLLLIGGIVIGFIGLAISDYFLDSFISYGVYMGMVLVNMACLINIHSDKTIGIIRMYILPLLVGATIAAVVGFALGVSTGYGGIANLILMPDITYFGIIMLLLLPSSSNKILTIIAIICFVATLIFQLSGKGVFINGLGFILLLYQVLSSKRIHIWGKSVVIVLLVGVISIAISNISLGDLSLVKIEQAKSLFVNGGDLDDVASSPKVRVATTMNLIDEGLRNPFFLLFGHGYGGYFQDGLGLMKGMDLTNGGWPPEIVAKGKFPSAHDTFSTVPLLNGFLGLIMLIIISLKYMRRSLKNPYAYAVVPWVLLTFYFNIQTAMAGMLFLFASERMVNDNLYTDE